MSHGKCFFCECIVRPGNDETTVDDPADHLRFDEEVAVGQTPRGNASVARRKLNDTERQLLRSKAMKPLYRQVLTAALSKPLSDADRARLWRLAEPTEPFSAMFRCLLEDAGI